MRLNRLCALIYLLTVAILFPYIKWYADNPDTFQYIEIAKKYIHGNFSAAVNGYWSPLISWLLVIPLLIINDAIIAFKILQVIIGIFVIYNWCRLLDIFGLRNISSLILCIVIVPFIADYSLLNCTPDLLFTGVSFLFLRKLMEENSAGTKIKGIKIGLIGALLFFSKAFGFPLFIAMTGILFLLRSFRNGLLKAANVKWMLGVFIILSGAWIGILSIKYHEFTISKAPAFNASVDVAPINKNEYHLPIISGGIYPAASNASGWETPGEYVSKETVSPFSHREDYLQVIKRNILSIYYFDFRRQPGIVFFILFLIFIAVKGFREFQQRPVLISLLYIFLCYGGYSLILIHTRYTWTVSLLMVLLSTYFIERLLLERRKKIATALIILFALFAIKRPLKEIFFTNDTSVPSNWIVQCVEHPFQTLWIFYRPDEQIQEAINTMKEKNYSGGRFVSVRLNHSDRDQYTSALRIALELNGKYDGQLGSSDNAANDSIINKLGINYVIGFQNSTWKNLEPVYKNQESGINIFRIK
jgi:hypothetical protein